MKFPGMTAAADVNICRFTKISADFKVIQCVAGDTADFVSREFVKAAPMTGASTLAGANGDPVQLAGEGEVCELEVGGAVVAGNWLKPDANGRGVVCTAGDKASARVIRGQATSGQRALVYLTHGVA